MNNRKIWLVLAESIGQADKIVDITVASINWKKLC